VSDPFPSVTVAIPAYNEADDIEDVVGGFLRTKYPGRIEVFVADGESTDGTPDIVRRLAASDPRVRLVSNPRRIQAYGLNLVLRECTGEVFLRADAHCVYAPDYLERCIEVLQETEATNVGGAQRFIARTPVQSGVALASRSLLGSGRARYRDPEYEGWVETVFLGCFRREALLAVSGYRPMRTNEDAELNLRLLEHAARNGKPGGPGNSLPQVLYTSPRIKVWYYPRTTWRRLFKQYFAYGRGRSRTVRGHPGRSGLRGQLPFWLTLLGVGFLLTDHLFLAGQLHSLQLGAAGIAVVLADATRVTLRLRSAFADEIWRGPREQIPSLPARALLCAGAILTQAVAHSLGFGAELIVRRLRGAGKDPGP
jgi:glycosyltransferase involved in cell wall biosynthesis